MSEPHIWRIDRTWDGEAARADEVATVAASAEAAGWRVVVDAPLHGDPAPASPVGSTPLLWEHEVVELFVLGADERYLELEFGPHGHYLVLQLQRARNLLASGARLDYSVARRGARRWRGEAFVPTGLLPGGLLSANAYAIHGRGAQRRYLCHRPVPGDRPDFHRLDVFAPLPDTLQRSPLRPD